MSKKEIVIKTARNLFSTYGLKKVTMDDIAQKSKVTKKTIYSYFKDKKEIIIYFLNEEIENMKIKTNEVENKNLPFENTITEMIYVLLDYKNNNKFLSNISKEAEFISLGTAHECIEILNKTILEEIEKKLYQAQQNNYIKEVDVKITAFIIYKVYFALMYEWDRPLNKEEVTKNIVSILKTGLFTGEE